MESIVCSFKKYLNIYTFYNTDLNHQSLPVCMDIYMIGRGWDRKYFQRYWNIGMCQGNDYLGSEDDFISKCCLEPGNHTLSCQNNGYHESNGWGDVSLEIQGQQYCNNFFGSTAFENVLITGKLMY